PRLINTLSSLSSLEAQILDYIHEDFYVQQQLELARLLKRSFNTKYTLKDIKLEDITIKFSDVEKHFNLNKEFTKIYIDNLETLGLLRYEEPEIEIDNGSTSADLNENEKDKSQSVDLDLD